MADFCKQCSEELFGVDSGDFVLETLDYPHNRWVICEGCGIHCIVNVNGACISSTCLKQHGKLTSEQDDIAMQEQEIARYYVDDPGYEPLT